MNILRTKRAFYMKWKPLFIVFEGLSFDGKIKNSRYKFKGKAKLFNVYDMQYYMSGKFCE